MDDLNDIKPGKLKRKPRRTQSTSIVDMPAVNSNLPHSGELLGDKLLSGEESDSSSLLELVIEEQKNKITQEDHDSIPKQLNDSEMEAKSLSSSSLAASPLKALASSDKHDNNDDMPPTTKTGLSNEDDRKVDVQKLKPIKLSNLSKEIAELSDNHKTFHNKERNSVKLEQKHLSLKLEQTLKQLETTSKKSADYLSQFRKILSRTEKRHAFNYIAAYLIFCITCAIIIYFAFQYKDSAKRHQMLYKNEVYQNAIAAKKILESEFERDQRGSTAAFEVFQLSEQGRYEEAVERFTAVRGELTHPAEAALLEQRIDTIRWRLADNTYHEGVLLYNAGNLEQARDAFYKSQAHKENTAYTHMLSFYLAQSLFQLGDFEGARRYYGKAQAGELSSDMDATARFNRATAAEKIGDEADAYLQYDAFLKRHRYHRLSSEAKKRRANLDQPKGTN